MKYRIHPEVVAQVDRLLETILPVATAKPFVDVVGEATKLQLLMEKHVYRPEKRET